MKVPGSRGRLVKPAGRTAQSCARARRLRAEFADFPAGLTEPDIERYGFTAIVADHPPRSAEIVVVDGSVCRLTPLH